jgi:tRNA-2-methylthio-N6-dimethylallyladenosine synthase
VSRSREDILDDVRKLVADGVVEITLLGQNVNSYGQDLHGKRNEDARQGVEGLDSDKSINVRNSENGNVNSSHFADLLSDLNEIDGLRRVRFMTSHPKDLTDDTIEAIARGSKICKHIHLPVQAGSDRILKIMNRKYNKAKYLETVEKIYDAIPGVSLTSDIMVGFPGETEEDFLETLDVVEKARYDGAFTFIFSPREGTPAARMDDQVPDSVKSERFDRLLALQNKISLEKNSEMIGKTVDVFVECTSKKDENILSGRTGTNKVVNFAGPKSLVHCEARVEITEAFTWHLSGKLKEVLIEPKEKDKI